MLEHHFDCAFVSARTQTIVVNCCPISTLHTDLSYCLRFTIIDRGKIRCHIEFQSNVKATSVGRLGERMTHFGMPLFIGYGLNTGGSIIMHCNF